MTQAGNDGTARPVVMVTGAAHRIGAAIARALHAAGCDLALHYRASGDEAEALRDALERERPDSVLLLQADLAEFDRLPELVAHTVGRFGRLDGLVNNASSQSRPRSCSTFQSWVQTFDRNHSISASSSKMVR